MLSYSSLPTPGQDEIKAVVSTVLLCQAAATSSTKQSTLRAAESSKGHPLLC